MSRRRIYDAEGHAQFVTFSCQRRRRLLDHPRAREIVIRVLAEELDKIDGGCCGFVVLPDHVHVIVWFPETGCLSRFMQTWKSRASRELKRFVRGQMREYASLVSPKDAFWQQKYHSFSLYSVKKAEEKLDYMHWNPVGAGLVERPCEWPWSSARYYELGEFVGVPICWVF